MDRLHLRAYTRRLKEKEGEDFPNYAESVCLDFSRVLTFDTETTTDQFQNLLFGYFDVRVRGVYVYGGLIHDPTSLDVKQLGVLRKFSKDHNVRLFTLEDFIEILLLEVYENKTLCIGYNFKFDFPRLLKDVTSARKVNGFSFKLKNDRKTPRLRVTKLNERNYPIKFTKTRSLYTEDSGFAGNLLDVQQPASVLVDAKSLSLEEACRLYNTKLKKKKDETYGKITPRHIKYCVRDVQCTYQVYEKVTEAFRKYQLSMPLTKIFSAASIGKQTLKQAGIQSFMSLNPHFPPKFIGYAMCAYSAGRCECLVRKQPVLTTVLDFFSMYPTIFCLLDLWKFVIAKRIEHKEVTQDIRKFVQDFTEEDGFNQKTWRKFNVLVQVQLNDDFFPARTTYHEKEGIPTLGFNYVRTKKPVWMYLPDVLAAKIKKGSEPKILKAIQFIPIGVQDSLRETEIYGVRFNPRTDNLIQLLVEKRNDVKKQMKHLNDNSELWKQLDGHQRALKIIVNAVCYGIYIELNPEDKKTELICYSDHTFQSYGYYEKEGPCFNSLIGACVTSGTHLLLVLVQRWLEKRGETHHYCDTDSMFVPPYLAHELSKEFNKLNPYTFDKTIFEIEEGMENIWFYGISAKRYCLYRIKNNKIIIPEGKGKKRFYKLHGLGHIQNPYSKKSKDGKEWHQKFWEDIINYHYNKRSIQDIINKYSNKYVVIKQAVTTPHILGQFTKLNQGKPFAEQIKAHNFFYVGMEKIIKDKYGNETRVKPIAPYCETPQEAIHKPFINKYDGEIRCGPQYWKPLNEVFFDYINHPESKFEGTTGLLQRKHLTIKEFTYIGKESDKLEEDHLEEPQVQTFPDLQRVKTFVTQLTPNKAREIGITQRSSLKQLKDRIKQGKRLNPNNKLIKKIIDHLT